MPSRRRVRAQVKVTRRVTVRTQQTVQRRVVPQVNSGAAAPALPHTSTSTPSPSSISTRRAAHRASSSAPIYEVAENLGELIGESPREFDVFISHASEDKGDLVRPLANALREAGLEVWYDEFELGLGDSLRRKIDEGIRRARFGIVVLSEAFFAKQWTQYELDGIVTAQVTGRQIILPLWHGVGRDEVFNFSPSLADKVAVDTATRAIKDLASNIVEAVSRPRDSQV
jgi:hypothetical protein